MIKNKCSNNKYIADGIVVAIIEHTKEISALRRKYGNVEG